VHSQVESGFNYERLTNVVAHLTQVAKHGLSNGSDFYFSTCDHPIIAPSTFLGRRAGFVAFCAHASSVSLDIPYPDPIDLQPRYFPSIVNAPEWRTRKEVAVFRGGNTNFVNFNDNHFASPRMQLALISKRHEGIIDAGLTGFNNIEDCKGNQTTYGCSNDWNAKCCVPGGSAAVMRDLGLELKPPMTYSEVAAFKYVIDADGGLGSGRLCGYHAKLRALVIRQNSPYFGFFGPLLHDMEHYVGVEMYWHDLVSKIHWLRSNDATAHQIALRGARRMEIMCDYNVRTLFWVKALDTYSKLLTQVPTLPTHAELTQCPGSKYNMPVRGSDCVRTPWRSAEDMIPERKG